MNKKVVVQIVMFLFVFSLFGFDIIKETSILIETKNFYLKKRENGDVVSISNHRGKGISLAEMKDLLKYKNTVKQIELFGGYPYKNDILKTILNFEKLEALIVEDAKINDDGLQNVGKISGLRILSLNNTNISDRGILLISNLNKLIMLSLANTNITDKSFKVFYKFKLIELDVRGTAVTKSAAEKYAKYRLEQSKGHDHVRIRYSGGEIW